ncbi:MAG: hypothetical protein RLZZ628_3088 [Bacteroidota bacterium]|jgi:hypothetical protein
MSRIILDLHSEKDVFFFLALAERFNAIVVEVSPPAAPKTKKSIFWLHELSKQGGITSIEDPSEWQRSLRQDRALPFRD